ncbi:MAG: mycofactocin biosynthesis glycosyltransferase MftF, partial [Acidimicrobiales bacterium]
RLTFGAQPAAARALAGTLVREWWPLSAGAALLSRRARRVLIAAAVLPALVEWLGGGAGTRRLSWLALRRLDDLAYGAGVWAGCLRMRSPAALVPRLASQGPATAGCPPPSPGRRGRLHGTAR